MEDIKLALLGDPEAQEAFTARGELLPCPFCGEQNPVITCENRLWWDYYVFCKTCGAVSVLKESERKVIEAWNTRPPLLTPTQMAVLNRLEEEK